MMQQSSPMITIGPRAIQAIGDAVELLLPWLSQSRFRILPNGNLEFDDAEPAEAVGLLRQAVEVVLPEDVRDRLGEKSGLGWRVFFGHVVGWWLPQRRHLGFLRALVDRAALHDIKLQLHWNADRSIPAEKRRPGLEALGAGAVIGVVAGLITTRLFPRDSALALLVFAAFVVAGRVYQRVGWRRVCGDPLCRAPIGRAKVCPSCGGVPT